MIEPYGRVIGAASDLWMLGCVLYLLTYRKHPFEGEGKLAILSASINYPSEYALTPLIKKMLVVEPGLRPTINQVIA
jgi:hypothetical protein